MVLSCGKILYGIHKKRVLNDGDSWAREDSPI